MSRLNEGEILKSRNINRKKKNTPKGTGVFFVGNEVFLQVIGFTRILRRHFVLFSMDKKAFDPEFEMKDLKRPAFSGISLTYL